MTISTGQRIKSARIAAGYERQGDFAKLLGISQASLSEIENGETKLPSSPVLVNMCELLGKSPRWILYGEEGDLKYPTKEEESLLLAFRTMSNEAKQAIISTATALSKQK